MKHRIVVLLVAFGTACVGRSLPLALQDAAVSDSDTLIDAGTIRPDAGFVRDAGQPRDAGIIGPMEGCVAAEDCDNGLPQVSIAWCRETSAWSCVDRQCAWECMTGGRSCVRIGEPCVRCSNSPRPECPDAPCNYPLDQSVTVEEATCARAFHREIARCFGDWVELEDGTLCSLHWLPTGAPRAVLVCGLCQMSIFF